jgi:hypothetical protein
MSHVEYYMLVSRGRLASRCDRENPGIISDWHVLCNFSIC